MRADYPTLSRGALLAPGIAVFVLFTASVCLKTLLHARTITAFETVQTVIAFLLAAVSLADFDQPNDTTILGMACLILSTACYAAVFTLFARSSAQHDCLCATAVRRSLCRKGRGVGGRGRAGGNGSRPAAPLDSLRVLRNGVLAGCSSRIWAAGLSRERVRRDSQRRTGGGHVAHRGARGPVLHGERSLNPILFASSRGLNLVE
ncbi:MAG TPA: hypothetical protein VMW15_01460 [Terracidiphilus sp.]|nr:hypothetical protein [Terracidiphilus sp.]